MNNLPGNPKYYCCRPWVCKERSDRSIAAGLFVYVDDGRPIGLTEEVCWEASRKWGSICSWIGIQHASRKVKGTSKEPRPWAGTVTKTTEVVCGLASQDC